MTEVAYQWVAANRDLLGRFLALLLVIGIGGCGSTVQEGSQLNVHLSLPLEGEEGPEGRDTLAGAELALEEAGSEAGGAPVEIVAESNVGERGPEGGWTQAEITANARDASEDSIAIGYIGELDSAATLISVPITNEAGIPQISPGAVDPELLSEAGGNDPPDGIQVTGERNLFALREAGEPVLEPDPEFTNLYRERYGRGPGESAAYGYESMALLLDAIDRAEDPLSRESVRDALLATSGRDSILGSYSIDPIGLASLS